MIHGPYNVKHLLSFTNISLLVTYREVYY
jgi:hypothetical protein